MDMDMNNFDQPKFTDMSFSIILEAWHNTEKQMIKEIPARVEAMAKQLGIQIWAAGYSPLKTTFVEDSENYGKYKSIGLVAEVEMDKTYSQRFYPLYWAFRECVEELGRIKASRWYKFLVFVGIIKPKN